MNLTTRKLFKKALKEGMLTGVTRMGRLHNLTMIASGTRQDKRKNLVAIQRRYVCFGKIYEPEQNRGMSQVSFRFGNE